jgi:uncharacterized protein
MAVDATNAAIPELPEPSHRISTLADVDRTAWEKVVEGSSLFSSYPWLRMLEQHTSLSREYLLWHRPDGELVAALPLYIGKADDFSASADPRRLFGAEPPQCNGDEYVVLAGAAHGYLNDGPLIRPDVSAAERSRLIAAMVAAVRAAATARNGYSAWVFLPATQVTTIAATGYGHPAVGLLYTSALLDLSSSGSFDDYLSTLPKKMRWTIRKERKAFAASGIRCSHAEPPADLPEVALLIELTYRHHGYPPDDPARTVDLLEKQLAWFGGSKSLMMLCRGGDRVVGTIGGVSHDKVLAVPWLGLDYGIDKETCLYYNLTYYLPIEYAIEHGLRSIDFGIGALQAKILRGAGLRTTWGLVEPPDRLVTRWDDIIATHNDTAFERLRTQFGDKVADIVAGQWHERAPGGYGQDRSSG